MWTMRRTLSFPAVFLTAALITSCGTKQATGGPAAQPAAQESATDSNAARPASPEPSASKLITIPAGTVLHVTIDQTVSSGANQTGDSFDASMAAPVMVDGHTVIARGARVRGEVVEAVSSGRLEHPGSYGWHSGRWNCTARTTRSRRLRSSGRAPVTKTGTPNSSEAAQA